MTEQKHTPGPWVLNDEERRHLPESDLYVCSAEEGRQREVCRVEEFYFEGEEAKANARLIAAAPEMLAELQRLHEKTGWQTTADLISRVMGSVK